MQTADQTWCTQICPLPPLGTADHGNYTLLWYSGSLYPYRRLRQLTFKKWCKKIPESIAPQWIPGLLLSDSPWDAKNEKTFPYFRSLACADVFLQLPQSTKLIPGNDKGSFDCRQVYRIGYSTYNVDDRERRCRNDYITATHNVNRKICWRSATLCETNGASTEMPCRFWYDSQRVESMVNWWRIDLMNFPGMGLVMQWAEDAEHPGRLNGFCQECAYVLERQRCALFSFCKMPKIISN